MYRIIIRERDALKGHFGGGKRPWNRPFFFKFGLESTKIVGSHPIVISLRFLI